MAFQGRRINEQPWKAVLHRSNSLPCDKAKILAGRILKRKAIGREVKKSGSKCEFGPAGDLWLLALRCDPLFPVARVTVLFGHRPG